MIFFLLFILLVSAESTFSENIIKEGSYQSNDASIIVVELKQASYYEMGVQYGEQLSEELEDVLSIVKKYYVEEHGITYSKIVTTAWYLYYKYPLRVQAMVNGISYGSGMDQNDCIVLSAIQFISPYFVPDVNAVSNDLFQCSFVSLKEERTKSGYPIIGRFFDLFEPFEEVVKYLVVTKFPESSIGEKSFITVGFPGEVQCLTCFNELGIFLEVNNGGYSGGKEVFWDKTFMPGRYFQIIAESLDVYQLSYQINSISPDFSWITNTADQKYKKTFSFEFSSEQDRHTIGDVSDRDFVVTNFFVNRTWGDTIPKPLDNETWFGVTRYNNLENLIEKSLPEDEVTISMFMEDVMDVRMEDGGALWNETVYQVVYDPEYNIVYLRSPLYDMKWTKINF